MKFNLDIKNKKGGFEADVEKLVEKGMDQHEKDWKDKFNTKYNAKKEMLEMKHRHKMECEEKNQTKKNLIERRKTKELELEDKRRKEEEQRKILKIKIILSITLGTIALIMMVIGSLLGVASGNPNSGWYAMLAIGFLPLFGAGFIWIPFSENKK